MDSPGASRSWKRVSIGTTSSSSAPAAQPSSSDRCSLPSTCCLITSNLVRRSSGFAMTKQEFLDAAVAAARQSSATSGLPVEITVSQAVLESAHGASKLAKIAHNYFGIKARRGEKFIELPTWEVLGGQRICIAAKFA